ncbi:MAG: tetratricopeptide repeat protein [Planctomycetaceae bacterium]
MSRLMVVIVVLLHRNLLAADAPLPPERVARIQQNLRDSEARHTEALAGKPDDQELYSQRGDARFFQGKFVEAIADYDKLVELDPKLETSHWRRGIAYFYAGEFDKAARQFEIYHTFDNIDRENGIWRYLSQVKSSGRDKAREGLLKYAKDDREPFPAVYKLFAGETTPQAILDEIAAANIPKEDRAMRLFYAELYIGLNHVVENERDAAQRHLAEAVKNDWGRRAGYGPNFMWHVGRLQEELLRNTAETR